MPLESLHDTKQKNPCSADPTLPQVSLERLCEQPVSINFLRVILEFTTMEGVGKVKPCQQRFAQMATFFAEALNIMSPKKMSF